MNERQQLAHDAVRKALSLRRTQGIAANRPVEIFDLVDALGIELRFLDVSSMEGLYYKDARPTILVSSLRPRGRRAFTCAHELGHHVFGHGTRVDELLDQVGTPDVFDPEEYFANSFASAILMPKAAVDWAFRSRGWSPEQSNALQVYIVAGWLNVGFETLTRQLALGLKLIDRSAMDRLLRSSPQKIRRDFLGFDLDGDLLIADECWLDRALDIDVGDIIAVPPDVVVEGLCVDLAHEDLHVTLLRGVAPGRGRVMTRDGSWSAYIRVSRRGYIGRSIFRHLEDPSDE